MNDDSRVVEPEANATETCAHHLFAIGLRIVGDKPLGSGPRGE
jgi:hypothetical protein